MKEVLKTKRDIASHVATLGLVTLSAGALLPYWLFKYNKSYKKPNTKSPKGALLVLGHRSDPANPSPCMISRTATARALMDRHSFDKIVLTGGGPTRSEASLMESLLGEGNFLLEEKSNTTYENFLFSKDLVKDCDHVVIVSSAYHARRIEVLAPQFFQSFEVVKAPSPNRGFFCHSSEALWSGWLETYFKIKSLTGG